VVWLLCVWGWRAEVSLMDGCRVACETVDWLDDASRPLAHGGIAPQQAGS